MARYHFVTALRVDADRQRVWDVIVDPVAWVSWWRWLRTVEPLDEGGPDLVGARYRLAFGTALPYTLSFESTTVRVVAPALIEAAASGDLRGRGLWQLEEHADGGTDLTYTWLVETTKPWMNLLAPIARPAFSWNHDRLMRDFAAGLARAVDGRLLAVDNSTVPPSRPAFYRLPVTRPEDRGT